MTNSLIELVQSKLKKEGANAPLKAFNKAIEDRTPEQLAKNLRRWRKRFIMPEPVLQTLLEQELKKTENYFMRQNLLSVYLGNQNTQYYWEILGIAAGGAIIYFGIQEEINQVVSVGYNYKWQRVVSTGAYHALMGAFLVFACMAVLLGKWKKRL